MLPVLRICLRLHSLLHECSNRGYRALTERVKRCCSNCGVKCPCYDHAKERRFEFSPFWGFLIFFVYNMRRVSCRAVDCGGENGLKTDRPPIVRTRFRLFAPCERRRRVPRVRSRGANCGSRSVAAGPSPTATTQP